MEIFRLAADQHSTFARDQARAAGVTDRQLSGMAERGVVELCAPGVFRVCGSRRTWRQRLMAATLSVPGAMASHRAAARMWGLDGFDRAPGEVVVERWHRRRSCLVDVIVHESKDLKACDLDERDGIPCTSLVRTLVDLPAVVRAGPAAAALDEAHRHDVEMLRRVQARHLEVARRGRNGTTLLRLLLAERGLGDLVDSGFERKALRLIEGSTLPRPVTQHHVVDGSFECWLDLAWPAHMVGVECDSLQHHLNERAFRWERKRRRHLNRLGWTILEFTYREVTRQGPMVLRELAHHLT